MCVSFFVSSVCTFLSWFVCLYVCLYICIRVCILKIIYIYIDSFIFFPYCTVKCKHLLWVNRPHWAKKGKPWKLCLQSLIVISQNQNFVCHGVLSLHIKSLLLPIVLLSWPIANLHFESCCCFLGIMKQKRKNTSVVVSNRSEAIIRFRQLEILNICISRKLIALKCTCVEGVSGSLSKWRWF